MARRKEAGQALIFGVVALGLLLMGFTGLGIDIGYLRYEKRLQQTATDNAALAGAAELPYAIAGNPTAAGNHAATVNGFTNGVDGATVTINNPPTSGPHNGDADYVEAYVAKVHPTFFMKILGITTQTVTARAVAYWGNGSGNSCIYTLGNPGTGVISVSGTPTLNAPTCGIVDNGDFCTNGTSLNITAGAIGVAGSRGNGHGNNCQGGTVTPAPITGIAPAGDPLAFLPAPAVGTPVNFDPANIVPGTTYNSITINTAGPTVFPAGTYIVNGNFIINGGSTVSGDGVTFYITNGGGVTINGTASVQFTAPTTGTYAGILFYQDPNNTSAADISGTSDSFFEGALYFPRAQLDFGGNGVTLNSGADYTLIVSESLRLHGTATVNLNSNFSSLPGGSPFQTTILVE